MSIAAQKPRLPVTQAPANKNTTTPPKWNHRTYGTLADPVHKSHVSTLIGEFACTEQFRRDRQRELAGEERKTASGKTEMGTAAHATIARALRSDAVRAKLLAGEVAFTPQSVRKVLLEEFAKATAGREVVWYGKAEYDSTLEAVEAMLLGLFADLHRHVAVVELVEAGWIAPVGKFWCEGHVDLVYRPRSNPAALGYTDWKTGAQKPHPIELDHGFESGLYSAALQDGLFLPVERLEQWLAVARSQNPASVPLDMADVVALAAAPNEREAMHVALRALARKYVRDGAVPEGAVQFGRFPEEIRLTHLADYVPYERAGKKKAERPEELTFWGLSEPGEVKYTAGQARGPAWYHVRRTPSDIARLERRLRTLVGWVRMGLFVDAVGEKCTRCSYRESCLTSGYELRGDDTKALNDALKGIDVAALGELEL